MGHHILWEKYRNKHCITVTILSGVSVPSITSLCHFYLFSREKETRAMFSKFLKPIVNL